MSTAQSFGTGEQLGVKVGTHLTGVGDALVNFGNEAHALGSAELNGVFGGQQATGAKTFNPALNQA